MNVKDELAFYKAKKENRNDSERENGVPVSRNFLKRQVAWVLCPFFCFLLHPSAWKEAVKAGAGAINLDHEG